MAAQLDIADGPDVVLGWVTSSVRLLLRRNRRRPGELAAIGIGLPVLVDNDVNIMALGERQTHYAQVDDLVLVKVATGIGSGIVSGGVLQRGAQGTAGDLGHVRVAGAEGVRCRCGNTGCLEAVAAGPAVAATLRATGLDARHGQDVVDLVRAGDAAAIAAVRQAGRDIGEVVAMMVNLINPSVVVIGGQLSAAGEHLLAGLRETVYQRSLPLATEKLRIVPTRAGAEAGVLGAAAMASSTCCPPRPSRPRPWRSTAPDGAPAPGPTPGSA